MKKVIGWLLLLSTPAIYAMEVQEAKQHMSAAEDHQACRKVMLKDALQAFISAEDDGLKYTPCNDQADFGVLEYRVKRRKKNDEKEDDINRVVHQMSMYDIGPEIFFIETIYSAASHLVDPTTVRGKLIGEYQKIHPTKCICGTGVCNEAKVGVDYLLTPAGVFRQATFRTLYMRAEMQQVLDDMSKKIRMMQNSAFPGSRQHNKKLLLPSNFNKNLENIKKLLENKKE